MRTRTNDLSRAPAISLVLGLLLAAGGSVVACSSVHLNPGDGAGTGGATSTTTTTTTTGTGGTTTTTTTSTTTGTGGGAQGECASNVDCTFPKAVCDDAKGACVECVTFADCGFRPGTVCSEGACVCPNLGMNGEPDPAFAFCPALGGQPNRCVNIQASKDDCGECGHACYGACNVGACADPWEPTSMLGAPEARRDHVAVWDPTDHLMIVWGGFDGSKALDTGAIYDPETRVWTKTSMVDAPSPRFNATAVWDDNHKNMIVWGGQSAGAPLGTGGLFDPMKNTWKPLPLDVNAPSPRWNHTVAWSSTSMVVWGGNDGTSRLNTGAIYESMLGSWSPMVSGAPAPAGRDGHTAVWRGGAAGTMFIWGGFDGTTILGDGATYDKVTGWASLNPNALGTPPTPRSQHSAVWTGSATLLWGGADTMGSFNDGVSHNGTTGDWTPVPPANGVPDARRRHTAVWVKNQMIVWGGESDPLPHKYFDNGYTIKDAASPWLPLPIVPIPGRAHHSAVVDDATGSMIIWGGLTDAGVLNSGAIYTAK